MLCACSMLEHESLDCTVWNAWQPATTPVGVGLVDADIVPVETTELAESSEDEVSTPLQVSETTVVAAPAVVLGLEAVM